MQSPFNVSSSTWAVRFHCRLITRAMPSRPKLLFGYFLFSLASLVQSTLFLNEGESFELPCQRVPGEACPKNTKSTWKKDGHTFVVVPALKCETRSFLNARVDCRNGSILVKDAREEHGGTWICRNNCNGEYIHHVFVFPARNQSQVVLAERHLQQETWMANNPLDGPKAMDQPPLEPCMASKPQNGPKSLDHSPLELQMPSKPADGSKGMAQAPLEPWSADKVLKTVQVEDKQMQKRSLEVDPLEVALRKQNLIWLEGQNYTIICPNPGPKTVGAYKIAGLFNDTLGQKTVRSLDPMTKNQFRYMANNHHKKLYLLCLDEEKNQVFENVRIRPIDFMPKLVNLIPKIITPDEKWMLIFASWPLPRFDEMSVRKCTNSSCVSFVEPDPLQPVIQFTFDGTTGYIKMEATFFSQPIFEQFYLVQIKNSNGTFQETITLESHVAPPQRPKKEDGSTNAAIWVCMGLFFGVMAVFFFIWKSNSMELKQAQTSTPFAGLMASIKPESDP